MDIFKKHLKNFTVKELKQEVLAVKKGFQVSKMKRADVENVILLNHRHFKHLLNKKKTVKKTVDKTVDKTAKKTVKKTVDKTFKKTVKKTVNKFDDKNVLSLVYFGPGLDFAPLAMNKYNKFKYFIFIDALPKLPHYEPGMAGYEETKDKKSFIQAITARLKKKV